MTSSSAVLSAQRRRLTSILCFVFPVDLDKDFPPLSRAGRATWWEERKPTVQTLDSTDEAQVGLGLSRILQEDNNWTPQPPAPKLVPREPEQEPAEARDRSQRSADEEFITVEELQEDLCRLLRRRSSSRKTVEWLQVVVGGGAGFPSRARVRTFGRGGRGGADAAFFAGQRRRRRPVLSRVPGDLGGLPVQVRARPR